MNEEENKEIQQPQPPAPENAYAGNPYYPPYKTYVPRSSREDFASMEEQKKDPKNLLLLLGAMILGVLSCELVLKAGLGAGVPIVVGAFYALAIAYFAGKKGACGLKSMILLLPILFIALSYWLFDSGLTRLVNSLVLLVLIPVQMTAMSRPDVPVLSAAILPESLRAFIGVPVTYADAPFAGIGRCLSGDTGSRRSRNVALVLGGALLSIPLMILFFSLFSSADSVFGSLVDKVLSHIHFTAFDVLFDLFLGGLTAVLILVVLFGLKGGVSQKREEKVYRGFVNSTLAGTFLLCINLVHVLFVAVQFFYLFGNGQHRLPQGMTYAFYARRGFFELCAAFLLAFAVVSLSLLLCKKREDGRLPLFFRLMITVLILCNLVIFASAVYRMSLYIQVYDLTIQRVCLTWLMALLGLCAVGYLVRCWCGRVRTFAFVFVSVVAMTVALNVMNVNVMVARYNIDQYVESGYQRQIDVAYLEKLGPSATRETARLLEDENVPQAIQAQALRALAVQKIYLDNRITWRNTSLAYAGARDIYEKYHINGIPYPQYHFD